MGMILITHDLGVVARIADDVAVMYCGQVVETGNITQIFDHPIHPYTRGLMECIPVPGKTKPGEKLGSIPGIVPTPIGDLWGCAFRNRCSLATSECSARDLELTRISDTRSFRCAKPPDYQPGDMDEDLSGNIVDGIPDNSKAVKGEEMI
ncbi:MAG: hypothetical protein B6230_07010 [Desulfobacteraceae bacterium 4572_89]|nr:MAG: hypothetical protein B6230_07010 [Desulfobacteraceae bacterium 4572_89]